MISTVWGEMKATEIAWCLEIPRPAVTNGNKNNCDATDS